MARKIKIDNAILKRFEQKTRKQKASKKISCRILIVCEGEKTEPNYFKKFKLISNNSFTYEVHCEGCGEGTMKVVNTAIDLAKKQNFRHSLMIAFGLFSTKIILLISMQL